MIDKDIHNLLIEKIGTVPESKKYESRTVLLRDYGIKIDTPRLYFYSTDQLIDELLPPEIVDDNGDLFFFDMNMRTYMIASVCYADGSGYVLNNKNGDYAQALCNTEKPINQALKELFKWVIINYPEQLRQWWER